MSTITRHEFLKWISGAAALAATSTLVGCGGNEDPPPADAPGPDAPAGCVASDAVTMIAMNHVHAPHKLTVTSAEVQAGVEMTYDIKGSAAHTHMVTLTADHFTMLKGGGSVMVTSTQGGQTGFEHTHEVTVSC
jgi:hypothetical protein